MYNIIRDKIDSFEGLVSNINFLSLRNLIPLKINVQRNHILDSTALFLIKNIDKLRSKKIHVSFIDEMGQDYGALLREFLYETSLEILNDSRLEVCVDYVDVNINNNCRESYLKLSPKDIGMNHPLITDFPEVLKGKNRLEDEIFYTYLGVFLGLLILFNENIDYSFSLSFYENLLHRRFTVRRIQDVQYQKSILWMLRNEVDEDILPGSNENNKNEVIAGIVHRKLFEDKKLPYEFIYQGFYAVVPEGFRDTFESDEMSLLISNERSLDVGLLKDFALYNMCTSDTPEVIWLWEILKTKDQIFLRKFLKFISGSGSIPMLINNYNFRIIIEKNNVPNVLFRASACLNKLFMGSYDTKENMENMLEFSVLNTEGFHKV